MSLKIAFLPIPYPPRPRSVWQVPYVYVVSTHLRKEVSPSLGFVVADL